MTDEPTFPPSDLLQPSFPGGIYTTGTAVDAETGEAIATCLHPLHLFVERPGPCRCGREWWEAPVRQV